MAANRAAIKRCGRLCGLEKELSLVVVQLNAHFWPNKFACLPACLTRDSRAALVLVCGGCSLVQQVAGTSKNARLCQPLAVEEDEEEEEEEN